MRPSDKKRKRISAGRTKVVGSPSRRAVARGGSRGFNGIARPKSRTKRY